MTTPACSHPEEAREPLPYDGVHPADPDDWRCDECGATNLRLDRRSYEDRVKAAEAERLAEIEFERFAERQATTYRTREVATREGKVVVALPSPAMDFRNESVADIFAKLYEVSGVAPVLTNAFTMIDATSIFDTIKEAIVASKETVITGGFDQSRPDSDLTATLYEIRHAGGLALKRVDRLEFAPDLFQRSLHATMPEAFTFDRVARQEYRMMGWLLDREPKLAPFAFRIVGS